MTKQNRSIQLTSQPQKQNIQLSRTPVLIKTPMDQEEILTEIDEIQEKLDTTYIDITEKISRLKRRILRHNFIHQNCANRGFSDIPFTTITYDEVM